MPPAIFFIIIAVTIIGYSYFIEPNILKTEKQSFKDCAENPINTVHISDLHFNKNTPDRRIEKILKKIKELNPQAIFITGDLIDKKNGIEKAKSLVEKLSQISPVFIVLGNWDYYVLKYNVREFKKELEKSGAKVLINQATKERIGEEEVNIIGIDVYADKNIFIGKEENLCNIVLAHSPNIIFKAKEKNIEIVLSGHTHGGQIYVPFLTKKIIPVEPEFKKFISGYYKEGNTQLYVNRGIGTSTLPFRFLIPPEITYITIE